MTWLTALLAIATLWLGYLYGVFQESRALTPALNRQKQRAEFFREWANKATASRLETEAALEEMRVERDSAMREISRRAS